MKDRDKMKDDAIVHLSALTTRLDSIEKLIHLLEVFLSAKISHHQTVLVSCQHQ